jgi:putative redox protein
VPRVVARRRKGYAHDVEMEGGHTLISDEPESAGGADEGPSPTRLLAASLAACTAITIEMYAERKGWQLDNVEVEVDMEYGKPSTPKAFNVIVRLPKGLTEEQTARLEAIAGHCPVHRALKHETDVTVLDSVELV